RRWLPRRRNRRPRRGPGGLVAGDGAAGNVERATGGVETSTLSVVASSSHRVSGCTVAAPRHVICNGHVVERDIAAVVEDATAPGIGTPGQGTGRAVVLGQTTADDQAPEDDLGARVDDLKDPILELAGVNDRLVVAG